MHVTLDMPFTVISPCIGTLGITTPSQFAWRAGSRLGSVYLAAFCIDESRYGPQWFAVTNMLWSE